MDSQLQFTSEGSVGRRPVYGNEGGMGILQRLDCAEAQNKENARQISSMKKCSIGYLAMRNRRLDIFKRDFRHEPGNQNRQMFADGNEAAHDGDAVGDAFLYTTGKRDDEDLLIELYGLISEDIMTLGKYQTQIRSIGQILKMF